MDAIAPAWHEDPRKLWKRRLLTMDIGERVQLTGGVTVKRAERSYEVYDGTRRVDVTKTIGHEPNRERRVEKIIEWALSHIERLTMAISELSHEDDRALLAQLLEDHLIPLEELDAEQVERLKSAAMVRETKDHMIMLTMSGRTAAEALANDPPANGNGKPTASPTAHDSPSNGVTREQLTKPLSDKSLETLRAVYHAGAAGVSIGAIKAHMLTVKKLRNLKLIRQRNDQLFITEAGATRLVAEAVAETANSAANDVTEPDADASDGAPELPQVEVEITVSADTPAEAAETIREVADAVAEGLIGGRVTDDIDEDDEPEDAASEGSTGCGDCFDCLDKRVLHMLMERRPDVAEIYKAEAARENAEMLRDSLLRNFEGG